MKKIIALLILNFSGFLWASAQVTEKGKRIKTPNIQNNKKSQDKKASDKKPEDEFDFIYEDQPKLKFSTDFDKNGKEAEVTSPKEIHGIKLEPLKELNELVNEDTSSLDESKLMIVEVEEMASFEGSDNLVQVASYFSIWDTRNIDPYHIDPKSFDQDLPLKIYNVAEGRNWSKLLDECKLTSHFGFRGRRWHKGTDLDLETGDNVYSAFDGIIRIAGTHSGWGRTVLIRHYNGLETLYGHLSYINFEPNTIVRAGDIIGLGGNTGRSSGSHLHFETRYEGNPFDSEYIYDFSNREFKIKSDELVLTPAIYDYTRGRHTKPKSILEDGSNAKSENADLSFGVDELKSMEEDLSGEEDEEEDEEETPTKIVKIKWYTVKPGDNLTAIARNFKISVAELARLNKINPKKNLFVGLRLRIN
jgi:murein DD-endopeptidase MepM/ murein hydrolase activator NlpD